VPSGDPYPGGKVQGGQDVISEQAGKDLHGEMLLQLKARVVYPNAGRAGVIPVTGKYAKRTSSKFILKNRLQVR
jgi:hypothetical protein